MIRQFGHEKLIVYREAVEFLAYIDEVLCDVDKPVVARDHMERASESIVLSIAEGNGRRAPRDRAHRFDIAHGSALECAGCLDVLTVKECIAKQVNEEGKKNLSTIVRMLVGLRASTPNTVKETSERYAAGVASPVLFTHERLHVYTRALEFVRWSHVFSVDHSLRTRHIRNLDNRSTSIVLNIAEGNGRFAVLDHSRFLDIAHVSALKAASCLDVLSAQKQMSSSDVAEGKRLLVEVVSMLVALKTKLREKNKS